MNSVRAREIVSRAAVECPTLLRGSIFGCISIRSEIRAHAYASASHVSDAGVVVVATVKVHFYQPMEPNGDPWHGYFPRREIMDRLDELNNEDPEAPTMPLAGGRGLTARRTVTRSKAQHGVMYSYRQDDFPMVRDLLTGEISPLDLGNRAGLAEFGYFSFYPRNVVAFIPTFRGPRIRMFERYLADKANLVVNFAPIPRPGVLRTLLDAEEVRSLEMTLPRARTEVLRDGLLGEELSALVQKSASQKIHIKFSVDARSHDEQSRTGFTAFVKDFVRRTVSANRTSAFDKLDARVGPEDAPDDPLLDFVNDTVILSEEVETVHGTKYLAEADAADAVARAYTRAQPALEDAVGPDDQADDD